MNNDIKPKQLYNLTDAEQIKAYVHPTRMMLLQLLAKERRTISSIAKELGVHPANITHHFKLLEKNGLICLVEKRDTGKNLEKYYRAIAFNFIVKPDAENKICKSALALSVLRDNLSTAVKTVTDSEDRHVLALLGAVKLNPEKFEELEKRLSELFDEFKAYSQKEGISYSLNISLYPNDINCSPESNHEIIIK